MSADQHVIVVGGGIVGLATAYKLCDASAELTVTVLEAQHEVGLDQSSRNSGVVHAGIYYEPGSDKARWCRSGKQMLETYCRARGLPFDRVGKLVVASTADEVARLDALETRARANSVSIERLTDSELKEREPNVVGLAALWTPETAITDFGQVCRSLADDIRGAGGTVRLNAAVAQISERAGGVDVQLATGETLSAHMVVVCGGLQSDRLAGLTGDDDGSQVVPFRGSWLVLRPELNDVVSTNIYPVPLPGLPFLGVHLTPRVDGSIWVGPNALLALSRSGDRPWSVSTRDTWDLVKNPGMWRLARKHWNVGIGEFWRDSVVSAAIREVQRYVPSIARSDVRRGPWGVRAQLVARDGALTDDFVLSGSGRVLHVRNAPSPAATASLAIGTELCKRTLERM